jgi:hypothetical protein
MAYSNSSGSKILRNKNLHLIPLSGNLSPMSTNWSTVNFTGGGQVSCLTSSISTPAHRLYIGTSNGGVYRVEDAPNNFLVTNISSGFPYRKGSYVSDIAVHPLDANKMLLVFSNYNVYSVYYSENGGDTWSAVAGNLEEPLPTGVPDNQLGLGQGPSARSCRIIFTPEGTVYLVGTSTGLFATDQLDGLNTVWYRQSEDVIGNAIVEKMDYRPSDNTVVMATHGNGVYSVNIDNPSGITGLDENSDERISDKLHIYPNPAKDHVTLQLPQNAGMVSIIDFQGKIIRTLRANREQMHIDVSALPAGVYQVGWRKGQKFKYEKLVIAGK